MTAVSTPPDKVGFGFNHISLPTPAVVTTTVRIITVFIAIFLSWMNTNDLIGEHTQSIISAVSGLIIGLINGLAPLFGINVTSAQVPVEDVQSMKTN